MGVFSGPDISESGLVLALDARNNKSHSSNRFISYGSGLVAEAVNFSVQGTTGFNRVAAGTVIGGYVVKTTDVVYSYALGSNGCHYHGNTAAIPSGVYATFSFDYLVTGATNYPSADFLANFENYGGGALSGSIATANNLQNVWQRRTFTSGPTGSAGTQAMFLYPGGCGGRLADSGTIYFKNPKVEWTNVDTGDGNFSTMNNLTTWYDMSGSANNGTLTNGPQYYNDGYLNFDGTDDYVSSNSGLINNSDFSVSFWIKYQDSLVSNRGLITSWDTSWNGFGISASGSNGIRSWTNNGAGGGMNWDSLTTIQNQWAYLVLTYTFSSKTQRGYINGVFKNSETFGSAITHSTLQIGRGGQTGSTQLSSYPYTNCLIPSVQAYNRALTASEVQQNFNATRSRFGI
jgi:hypothetical protein